MRNIITLSNGKKVGNFSSPHAFTFTDGSILDAVSDDVSRKLSLKEVAVTDINGDTEMDWIITYEVKVEIDEWYNMWCREEVDVVYVPLPMLLCLKEQYGKHFVKDSPFRGVRIEDRIKKLISIDKQCI